MGKKEDVTGRKYGRLTFVAFTEICGGKTFWKCQCDCGNAIICRVDQVKSGNTQSCGCLAVEEKAKYCDLTGLVFNRLTVLREAEKRGRSGQIKWECRCICGKVTIATSAGLRTGHTNSCGCFHREQAAKNAVIVGKRNRRHGLTRSKEYQVWHGLRQRCQGTAGLEASRNYHDRGIKVCKRWNKFENFLADMGPRPTLKHQIDRIDVNGNYTPKNCRWATPKEQQRNRRNNVLVEFNGKTQCVAAWAEESGLRTDALWNRLFMLKWSVEKALSMPTAKTIRQKLAYVELRGGGNNA